MSRRNSSQVQKDAMSSQQSLGLDDEPSMVPLEALPGIEPVYGDVADDAGDQVRFHVELTRLPRLEDHFVLEIRRLKGALKSYKFLYDTLRQ